MTHGLDIFSAAGFWSSWLPPLLAAPFIGSFAGVLIARIPAGRSVVTPRSACESCGHALGATDLVPIASFLALRGKCRFCHVPIPRRIFWVECASLGIAAWAAAAGERGAFLWAGCALGWTLLALGWIDALCQRLPDVLTLPLLLAGLAEAYFLEPDAITDRALGAAIGYAGFRLLALAYARLRGREGLGQGDAKLLGAAGTWVGALLLPNVLLLAACTALLYAFRRLHPNATERIPFGPFLAAGIWLVWLYA